MPPYYRKEEILHEGKRYRLHNNYLTIGGGILWSSIRGSEQRNIGADYNFHIRKNYFQAGLMMSGPQFLSNNNVQAHLGYGLRKETVKTNFAAYAGATWFTGVVGRTDSVGNSVPQYYSGVGFYISGQAVTKFTYDIGIGMEVFAELNSQQSIAGFKVILFFSGAYRGLKQKYNPNVRAENP